MSESSFREEYGPPGVGIEKDAIVRTSAFGVEYRVDEADADFAVMTGTNGSVAVMPTAMCRRKTQGTA